MREVGGREGIINRLQGKLEAVLEEHAIYSVMFELSSRENEKESLNHAQDQPYTYPYHSFLMVLLPHRESEHPCLPKNLILTIMHTSPVRSRPIHSKQLKSWRCVSISPRLLRRPLPLHGGNASRPKAGNHQPHQEMASPRLPAPRCGCQPRVATKIATTKNSNSTV